MTTGSNRGQTPVLPEPRPYSPFMVQLLAYLHQWGLRKDQPLSGNSPTCRGLTDADLGAQQGLARRRTATRCCRNASETYEAFPGRQDRKPYQGCLRCACARQVQRQHPMSDPQPNVSRPIGYAGPRTGSAQATTTADGVPLASWWWRALAALIDILIVATIITIITFGVWRSLYAARGSATSTPCWMPRAKGSRRLR